MIETVEAFVPHATVAVKPVTVEDLWQMSSAGRYELLEGALITLSPTSGRHGIVEIRFGHSIREYLKRNPVGEVMGGDPGFILSRNPDTVRAPDVAFLVNEKIERVPRKGFMPFPPDLVVEVVSPGDSFTEVTAKVAQWLEAGTRTVWVADEERKKIHVYEGGRTSILHEGDTLTGGDVLPGFAVPVAEFFP